MSAGLHDKVDAVSQKYWFLLGGSCRDITVMYHYAHQSALPLGSPTMAGLFLQASGWDGSTSLHLLPCADEKLLLEPVEGRPLPLPCAGRGASADASLLSDMLSLVGCCSPSGCSCCPLGCQLRPCTTARQPSAEDKQQAQQSKHHTVNDRAPSVGDITWPGRPESCNAPIH